MERSFRQRRFGQRRSLGEDVNPSAYIVNLADCMLVLACGVIVSLVAFYNLDLTGVTKLKSEQMQPIDPLTMPEEVGAGGTNYIEAGIVYMDPTTGEFYMIEGAGHELSAGQGQGVGATQDTSDEQAVSEAGTENENADAQSARINGAD